MSSPIHVHFGTGNFGLGFVGPLSNKLGYDLQLVNRDSINGGLSRENAAIQKNRGYKVSYNDGTEEHVKANFCPLSSRDDVVKIVRAASLVTTSLKDIGNVRELAPILEEGLSENQNNPVVIACENSFSSKDIRVFLSDHASRRCVFPDAVVDRICNNRFIQDDFATVTAERFGILIVEDDLAGEHLRFKKPSHEMVKVVKNLKPSKLMKIWLMNGSHLAISIHAHYKGVVSFNEFCSQNPEFTTAQIDEIYDAFCGWLAGNVSDLSEREAQRRISKQYASSLFSRYTKTEELVARLLGDFTSDHKYKLLDGRTFFDLQPFSDKMVARIAGPAESYVESYGDFPPLIGLAMLRFFKLLARRAIPS